MTVLTRVFDNQVIPQRASDGYINATAMCKAAGKEISNYLKNTTTKDYIEELSSVLLIRRTELIQILRGGTPELQGTWVHPEIALDIAQWLSPKFKVLVNRWVSKWLTGDLKPQPTNYHIQRLAINKHKIPDTHFSILDQMIMKFICDLEFRGYCLPKKLMPDISMGRMFSDELKAKGYDLNDKTEFPTYWHEFNDGVRPTVEARLYPNSLLTLCNQMINRWIREKATTYFKKKDPTALPVLTKFIESLPSPKPLLD